jgi:hypothetical protein
MVARSTPRSTNTGGAEQHQVVADYPEQEIDVLLDNPSTHKPKRDQWLARRNKVSSILPRPMLLAQPGRDLVLDPRPQP